MAEARTAGQPRPCASKPFTLTPALVRAYLAVLRGGNPPPVPVGATAPPLACVVAAQHEARRVIEAVLADTGAVGVVQVGYASELARGLRVGESLAARAHVELGRPTPVGRFADLDVSLTAVGDERVGGFQARLVLFSQEQLGTAKGLGLVDRSPDEPVADDRRGGASFALDTRAVRRYADISGDDNPVHVDDGAARQLGLPGCIAHGMLVLAAVVERALPTVGPAAADRVRRVQARFTRPVLVGETVTVSWSRQSTPGGEVLAFKAHTGGSVAVKSGVVELSPALAPLGSGPGARTC